MVDQQAKSHKRYGKNKAKCARYYAKSTRSKHKLRNFIKNNIGKLWDDNKVENAISNFKDMQYKKHQKHALI